MIDEATTTVSILRAMRDRTEDHFDPDQTATPRTVATGVRANISQPTNRWIEGTREVTSYRFFCDPLPDGEDVRLSDQVVDERDQTLYSLTKALLRVDPDYPEDLCERRALTHIVGEVVTSKGVRR